MRIKMNYGLTGLPLTLPDDWDITIIRKPRMPVLPRPEEALRQALAQPVASKALRELAQGVEQVCILICDITRPVPNKLLLQGLLADLSGAGLRREQITILVATGLHRPNEGEELLSLIGSREILEQYNVANHFASRDEDHVFLEDTSSGVPVGLDRRFAHADLRIVTGLVEPHFMAGFSGGRKVIAPGICHESTIRSFHNSRIMGDPKAANLNLADNPLHNEQLEIVSRLAPVYAVNTVLDEDRQLSFVNFGELLASHQQAVDFARPYFRVEVPRRFKTILTSAAGSPLDLNFYQTVKGLVGAKEALEPGGRIFIVSECREGLGSKEFRACQERLLKLGWQGFLEEIAAKTQAGADEWETQKLTEIFAIGSAMLYAPLLSLADRALTGIPHTDELEKDLAVWINECGDSRLLVIPEGPYVIPVAV